MTRDAAVETPAVPSSTWAPQEGSQSLFIQCPIYEALYEGTRGPGKTLALLMDFAQHCGVGFGAHWRGVLFRQTYKQLSDVIAKSKMMFYSIFPGIKWNSSEHVWTWPTGEQLLLRHFASADDYWNYHGHEYPWIGWEELTNWPNSECYDSMKSCSRSAFPGMPRKYRSTCNPYGVGHNWVKAMFVDPAPAGVVIVGENNQRRVRIHGHVLENKRLLAADPDYINKLRAISNEHKRKAWLHGSWDIVSGGMFDDVWDEAIHVLRPFPIPSSWRIDRSFDWGSSAPFSVGWWARSDGTDATSDDGKRIVIARGSLIRVREWYGAAAAPPNTGLRMLSADIAIGIKQREAEWGFPVGRVRPGPADTSIFAREDRKDTAGDMEKAGVKWLPAVKSPGSRKDGWEVMRQMFENARRGEGPGMYAFSHCNAFRRFVPVAPRDDDDADDIDTAFEDHVLDESRYRALHNERIAVQEDM